MEDLSTYEPERASSACINGSRKYGRKLDTMRALMLKCGQILRNQAIKTIYVGGADGIDTDALKVLRSFRDKLGTSFPLLVVVCPCTIEELPPEARQVAEQCADRIIELENRITAEDGWAAFKIRNCWMVDRSAFLYPFWNQANRSGTKHAIDYAVKKGGVRVDTTFIAPPQKKNNPIKAPRYGESV